MLVLIESALLILVLATCYLVGSIPFGLLVAKYAGLGDIRKIGSGNIGATNVLRTGRKSLAILTLFLDILKGFIAVRLALFLLHPEPIDGEKILAMAGLAALVGHMYPVWLNFKGGKGVATTFGVFCAINWVWALILFIIWVGVAYAFRYSSLAAIVSSSSAPFIGLLVFDFSPTAFWCSIAMVSMILWRHKANIQRLWNGTESKLFSKSEKAIDDPAVL